MLKIRYIRVLIIAFVIGSFLAIGALGYKKHERERAFLELKRQQKQLNALAIGVIRYAQDHQEHLPSGDNWKTQLVPYVAREVLENTTRVTMNKAMSGRSLEDFEYPNDAILFFESRLGSSAEVDAIQSQSETGQFAVCFADGHGYPRELSSRNGLIRRSKEVTKLKHKRQR